MTHRERFPSHLDALARLLEGAPVDVTLLDTTAGVTHTVPLRACSPGAWARGSHLQLQALSATGLQDGHGADVTLTLTEAAGGYTLRDGERIWTWSGVPLPVLAALFRDFPTWTRPETDVLSAVLEGLEEGHAVTVFAPGGVPVIGWVSPRDGAPGGTLTLWGPVPVLRGPDGAVRCTDPDAETLRAALERELDDPTPGPAVRTPSPTTAAALLAGAVLARVHAAGHAATLEGERVHLAVPGDRADVSIHAGDDLTVHAGEQRWTLPATEQGVDAAAEAALGLVLGGTLYLSVDLETLARVADAPFPVIGVQPFVYREGRGHLLPGREWHISIDSALARGARVKGGTITWRLTQDEAARTRLADSQQGAIPERQALEELSAWLATFAPHTTQVVALGLGAVFDLAMIDYAHDAHGLPNPVPFWNQLCARTLLRRVREVPVPREGVRHAALDDAAHVARRVITSYAAAGERELILPE